MKRSTSSSALGAVTCMGPETWPLTADARVVVRSTATGHQPETLAPEFTGRVQRHPTSLPRLLYEDVAERPSVRDRPEREAEVAKEIEVYDHVRDEHVAVEDPTVGIGAEQRAHQHRPVGWRRLVSNQSLSHNGSIVSSRSDSDRERETWITRRSRVPVRTLADGDVAA